MTVTTLAFSPPPVPATAALALGFTLPKRPAGSRGDQSRAGALNRPPLDGSFSRNFSRNCRMKPICRSAQLVLLAAAALLTPPALAQTPPAAWLPAVLHLLLACTPEPGASVCLPRVALTTPANASFFSPPATIQLAATASDEDGSITKVEFYNGTALLTSVLTPPYQFTWNNVGIGTYALTAKAYSSQGASRGPRRPPT